jgi:hypothetical protein|tara:strand:- start:175 stop:576 length:402 start_codon:yes stop_codon:yes gene_type:complete
MEKVIHTIHKGFIGEIAVIKDLVTNYTNYNVFKPIIDEKGVDLIVERRKKEFLRVQVKTITEMKTKTSIEVRLHKYRNKDLIDIVAVYYAEKDLVCYVPYENENSINLALKPSKNNQMKNRRFFYQYMEFPVE